MNFKCAWVAGALILTGPAFGVTVNITDFTFTPAADVSTTGTPSHSGPAGQYKGNLDGAPFTAYCAELEQGFLFNVDYEYTRMTAAAHFGAQKSNDLSRLFTATNGWVHDASTAGAMQAAVWEVVHEMGSAYNLTSGTFTMSPTGAGDTSNFAMFNSVLGNLNSYGPDLDVDVLHNPYYQDMIPVPSIPEPGTWALLVAGLGVVGLLSRRRSAARND